METETRSRPELRPVWTGHGDQPQPSPRTTALSATSPLYSASLSLPSPMHPISPGYDPMRAHERALVDKLDRGRRESQLSPTTARSLSPISEQTPDARRGSTASLPLPRAPAPSPLSPTLMQYTGPQTLAARTREILLGGMPDGLLRSPLAFSSTSAIDERRQSLPPPPPSGGRRNSQQIRNDLRQWGHVYYGDSTIADCFVSAVSAVTSRKNSESSSTDGDGVPLERSSEGSNQVTIRVRVRPCALNREPFLLTRTLDMDRLRATIPEPPPLSAGPQRRASEVPIVPTRSPLPTSRRRSSVAAGAKHGLDPDRSHVQNTSTVPIHAPYARAYFPVLAVILYSGHIEKGDIIQLPMPNPKAWARTVAYVYTGQGELTEAIKQNIEHLGGKV